MPDTTSDTPRKRSDTTYSGSSPLGSSQTGHEAQSKDEARKAAVHHPETLRSEGDAQAPHLTPVTPEEDARTILLNQVTWGAVLAGVVVMMVLQVILNMVGLGIGASSFDVSAATGGVPNSDNPSLSTFSIAAAVWWIGSGIVASFVGGYAAGRLTGVPKESTAGWHGLTAWAASTLLVLYMLTSAMGGVLGGAYNTVASAAGIAAQAGAQGQQSGAFGGFEQSIRGALGGSPDAAQNAAAAAVRGIVTGDPTQQQLARDQAATAIAQAQKIPIEQARTQVQQYEAQYRQTLQTARQTAEEAKDTVANSALVGALALILGALAAWFGGRSGAVHPTLTDAVLGGRALRNPFERRVG